MDINYVSVIITEFWVPVFVMSNNVQILLNSYLNFYLKIRNELNCI